MAALSELRFLPITIQNFLGLHSENKVAGDEVHVSVKNSTITIQISNPRANMEEIGRLLEPLGAAEVNGGVITIH